MDQIRIYIGADYTRKDEVSAFLSLAEAEGILSSCRWAIQGEPGDGLGGPGTPPELATLAANMDIDDINDADVFIALTTGNKARGGRHVELGYAIGRLMPILIVGPYEHVFHYRNGISRFDTFGEALAWLKGYSAR